MKYPFYFKKSLKNYRFLSLKNVLFNRHVLKNEKSNSFEENMLPMITFELANENKNFGKLVSAIKLTTSKI